jgi:5'-3' exonuclease
MNTLHLIDASLYIFRAWHSMPNEFHDSDGAPVNAVHGFTRFLCDFLERTQPSHALAAFDESLVSSFRNAIYPAYKANRELPPPELKVQFDYCKQVAAALGLRVLADAQFEADDLIGSAVTMSRKQNFRAVIVSADKDFGQLIGRDDEQWDFSRAPGSSGRLSRPDRRCGRQYPGVSGIGAKTAASLLGHFGSLDALLLRIEEVPYLRLRGAAQVYARLKADRDQALLSQRLAAIVLDAPVPDHVDALRWRDPDRAAIDALFDRLRFGPLTRSRVRALRALRASA